MTETNKFPIKEDLQGAALALTRLQDTYLLSTEMISEGCLSDSFCSIRLSGTLFIQLIVNASLTGLVSCFS